MVHPGLQSVEFRESDRYSQFILVYRFVDRGGGREGREGRFYTGIDVRMRGIRCVMAEGDGGRA